MTGTDAWASLSEQLASRPPSRRPWARLFVPDLAVYLAMIAVFCALVFFNAPQMLFRDSTTGLDIRIGERILDVHGLPRTNPFTFAHTRWTVPEWGSDVVLGIADRVAGLSGVAWLSLVALGLATWLWVRFHWACGGNFFLTLTLFLPLLWMVHDSLRATPSLVGWIFLPAFLIYFENVQARFTARVFILLAAVAAVWANLDRSFLFLPPIAALYAASHLARPLIWTLDPKEEWRRAQWFAWIAVVTLAAGGLLNPYGLRFPAVSGAGSMPLFTLALACVGGVLALAQSKVAHFLIAFFLAGITLRWPRFAPLLTLLLLPIANGAITGALRKSRNFRPTLRKRLTDFLQRSDHVRLRDARFGGLLWTPFAALMLLGWLVLPMVAARIGFPRSEFPVDAAVEFAVLPGNLRVLAPPQYGDYLIYRFDGRLPVFVHSGMDGADHLLAMQHGWRAELDAVGFTHALLPQDAPLAQALEALGWTPIFEDEASILLRRARAIESKQ